MGVWLWSVLWSCTGSGVIFGTDTEPSESGPTQSATDAEASESEPSESEEESEPVTDSDEEGVVLFLNEVLADNGGSTSCELGEAHDWLELYNPGTEAVDLDGLTLSDDYTEPAKVALPSGLEVPAGGHLLLFADGEGTDDAQHVALRLSAEGEGIGVFAADGTALDWLLFPALDEDQAHARLPDGGDTLESMPVGTPGAPNASVSVESVVLVETGATWAYRDSGVEAEGWQEPDYDASGWSTGPAPLGYGDSQTTQVSYGGNANDKHITTWFRHDFTVSGTVVSAELELLVDDGALVWLNGEEVVRHNLASGEVTADTLASATVYGTDESTYVSFEVDASAFEAGANVLAVEVHQAASNSSDLTLDLGLSAEVLVE